MKERDVGEWGGVSDCLGVAREYESRLLQEDFNNLLDSWDSRIGDLDEEDLATRSPLYKLERRIIEDVRSNDLIPDSVYTIMENYPDVPIAAPIDLLCTVIAPWVDITDEELEYINYLDNVRFGDLREFKLSPTSMERIETYLGLCRLTSATIVSGTGRIRIDYKYNIADYLKIKYKNRYKHEDLS